MLGIDVSKESLVCALVDANTHDTLWEKTVPNTASGVERLLDRVPAGVAWVIEPTGRYSIGVVKQAQSRGRDVRLAPPRKAKSYLQSLQSRAKNDALDARGLAIFGLTRPLSKPLAPYPLKSENVERLDQLLSARKGLSLARAGLEQRRSELPYAQEALSLAVAALKEQIGELDRQIAAATLSGPEFAAAVRMQRVPGIGKVTAAAVTARLAAKKFAHSDQFVAYIGLDVAVHESGSRKGQRRLTKQGDAEIRRLLYLCAQASLRATDSPFRLQYERELAKGLPTTAALCTVARKMAHLCWSLHKHGTAYDPARVYKQPSKSGPAPTETETEDPSRALPDHSTARTEAKELANDKGA